MKKIIYPKKILFLKNGFIATIFIFISILSHAADQTQSQVNAADTYHQCMTQSLYGQSGCNEANECIGAQRAAQNSGKKSVCKIKVLFFCLKWGHKQNTQEGWAAVAGQHLANAQKCQQLQIKSTDNAHAMLQVDDLTGKTLGSTANGAISDGSNSGISASYDDGAETYGLPKGEVLKRVLNGEKFGDIIASSPFAEGLKPEEVEGFRNAGNNPDETLANQSIELAKGGGDDDFGAFGEEGATPAILGNTNFANQKNSVLKNNQEKSEAERNLASIDLEKLKYGKRFYGDKTIFQMVSSQYKKQVPTLLSFDFYLEKKKEEIPQDVKAMISNSPDFNLN